MPSNPFGARAGVTTTYGDGRTVTSPVSSSGSGSSVPTFTGTSYDAYPAGNLEEITNLINTLNLTAQQQANAARIPNATGLETQSSANIQSQLSGQLPADVVNQIAQAAAERGVAGGVSGSPNDTAAYLKALGLTSYDMTQAGQQNLTAALGRNPAAATVDPSSFVITPTQAASIANQTYANQLAAWQAQQNANLQSQQLDLERWKAEQANSLARQSANAATKSSGSWYDNLSDWEKSNLATQSDRFYNLIY